MRTVLNEGKIVGAEKQMRVAALCQTFQLSLNHTKQLARIKSVVNGVVSQTK